MTLTLMTSAAMSPPPEDEDCTNESQIHDAINEAVESLPENLRELAMMRNVLRLPLWDCAERLGLPYTRAKNLNYRIIRLLRAKLSPIYGEIVKD